MTLDHIFLIALQSSLFLGLIHGINPCGHSWLVLAPFVYGETNGKKVFSLTSAFIIGTSLACLAIGLSLGAVSMNMPESIRALTDIITSGVLVMLGTILLIKPELLHSHSHDHPHAHNGHSHTNCGCSHDKHDDHDNDTHTDPTDSCCARHHGHHGCSHGPKLKRVTFWGLFVFGFMNMIVPCPTVAIMYSYALDSGDMFKSTAVFASYALGTGIALAGVIFAIYKVANAMRTLNTPWLEPLIMRTAGVLTIAFGVYSYLAGAGYL